VGTGCFIEIYKSWEENGRFDGRKMNYGARLAIVPGLKLDAGLRDHQFYTGITFIH
jgi:hypothetical protein